MCMTISIDQNSSTWIRSQADTVEDRLLKAQKEIADTLDYEVCLSLIFNEWRNVAVVKSKYVNPKDEIDIEIPNTLFINKSMYAPIKEMINTKKITEVNTDSDLPLLLKGMESEVYIPIFETCYFDVRKLRLIGSLYLGSRDYKKFKTDGFSHTLDNLVSQISSLYTMVLSGARDIIKSIDMISVFIDILDNREKYLSNHSFNVANWCREIGMKLGYDSHQLMVLSYAGLLHDIGKCMIDDEILNKPDKLTEEELNIIKEHPQVGYRIAEGIFFDIPLLKSIPKIIKHHHERYDGKGYPSGLKGEEVPFYSYIIGIADSVDAMLSKRPYKEPMTLSETIKELKENKGKQFHPLLVDIMIGRLTKAQNQLEVSLIQRVELSSLIISFKEKLVIVEGTLIHLDGYYLFKPEDEFIMGKTDIKDITYSEVAIKNLNSINYYEAKIEDIINDNFYISSIKLIPSDHSFSMLWNLDGILYEPDSNNYVPIEIAKIGGDSLSFYFDDDYSLGNRVFNKIVKVKILFDDSDIEITGCIVKTHNFGVYKYYYMKYTNIPESKRDKIYRHLFKKQIEMRKTAAAFK